MGRINNLQLYPLKNNIVDGDYFLGSDSEMSNRTANFSMASLTSYLEGSLEVSTFVRNNLTSQQTIPNLNVTTSLTVGGFQVITEGASLPIDDIQTINTRLQVRRSINLQGTPDRHPFLELDAVDAQNITVAGGSLAQLPTVFLFNTPTSILFQGNMQGDDIAGIQAMVGGVPRDILHTGNVETVVMAYVDTGLNSTTLPTNYLDYNFVSLCYTYTPSGGSPTVGCVQLSTTLLAGNTGDRRIELNANVAVLFDRSTRVFTSGSGAMGFNELILTV